ncbi:alpha-L-fucosidase, partial [Actinoplanes sp. NPDC051633]|uniref:alpha-L-fucosidase n=1 Tax=Actinoplanes sp. NPDC051633 TaxID=3155670 RepID=UPI00341F37E5
SCRGIGYSFGYNRLEDARHYLDARGAVKELVDVVSRGGNLLLNVGPDAAGRIPAMQRSCLEGIADWMAVNAPAVQAAAPVDPAVAQPSDEPWTRWTQGGGFLYGVVDAGASVDLPCRPEAVDVESAALLDGTPVAAHAGSGRVRVDIAGIVGAVGAVGAPAVVRFPLR